MENILESDSAHNLGQLPINFEKQNKKKKKKKNRSTSNGKDVMASFSEKPLQQ